MFLNSCLFFNLKILFLGFERIVFVVGGVINCFLMVFGDILYVVIIFDIFFELRLYDVVKIVGFILEEEVDVLIKFLFDLDCKWYILFWNVICFLIIVGLFFFCFFGKLFWWVFFIGDNFFFVVLLLVFEDL